jgi:hypothetical protein
MNKYRIDAEVRVSGGPWTAYTTTVETPARTAPTAHKAAFDIKHHESRMHGVAGHDVQVRKTKVTPLD